jgi:uncharacterized protein (TIGR02996 family)
LRRNGDSRSEGPNLAPRWCAKSEEAAFLEALKTNPADDTARLVYADWLDEHGEPQKAAYLRLVAELARECDGCAAHPHGLRLRELSASVSEEWRAETGSRFVATLFNYDGAHKILVIKLLRELTGQGLAEAKAMSESLPHRVSDGVTFESASEVCRKFRQVSSAVISLLPIELERLPYDVRYEVQVQRYIYAARGAPLREEASREALRQFIATTIGGNRPEVPVGGGAYSTILFRNLTLEEANARVQELRCHLPSYDPDSGWYLWVGMRHITTRTETL